MSEKPRLSIAVVMQRRAVQSRWAEYVWEPCGVLTGHGDERAPRPLVERPGLAQWLHPGFALVLHRDELEGYYMNGSASAPRVSASGAPS